jgi:predicted Zn-dependent protease
LLAAAEEDPGMARALRVVAAILRVRTGDKPAAVERLRVLHEEDAGDLLVGVLLADLERAAGDVAAAARALSNCAGLVGDAEVAAALHLEAAFLLWRVKQRAPALEAIRAAREQLPEAAVTALLWASAALDADTVEGRRRVLDLSEECGADKISVALERFALESCEGGDVDQAGAALDVLERDALGELGVAGWLGRLVHASEFEDGAARGRALEGLETLGLRASAVVAAERYRFARSEEKDRDGGWGSGSGHRVACGRVCSRRRRVRKLGSTVARSARPGFCRERSGSQRLADRPDAIHRFGATCVDREPGRSGPADEPRARTRRLRPSSTFPCFARTLGCPR